MPFALTDSCSNGSFLNMKTYSFIFLSLSILLLSPAYGDDRDQLTLVPDDAIIVPRLIEDPLEPINRRIWSFNSVINKRLIHPVGQGYRFIVRKPVREKINNFSENLTFPRRFINNLLQGRWKGARRELHRFAINTTIGGVGLFDPASSFNLSKSEADFGQTFGRWGWDPSMYVVIPVFGPSNERDSIGLAGDTAVNPAYWLSSPYLYGTYGFAFNNIVDKTGEFKRFTEAGADTYSAARQISAVLRENDISKFRIPEMPNKPSINLLSTIFTTLRNPVFSDRVKTRSALIPSTGKRLKFSVWMQGGREAPQAPVVYLLSGLGSHRLSSPSLARAELIYSQGYSVVSISDVFNTEFMESASTTAVPGYSTVDNHDLHVALDAIDRNLTSKYGSRIGKRALFGVSAGAFQTMMLAASCASKNSPLIQFERYIAIYPPVDMLNSLDTLDDLYNSALNWPARERSGRIVNTFRKVGYILAASKGQDKPANQAAPLALPFDRTEADFLIGYAYHTVLRDIIFSSQSRNNFGLLQQPISKFRRAAVYEEIDHYKFTDYLNSFVIPYYKNGDQGDAVNYNEIRRVANLKNFTTGLRRVSDLRIISSDDDFLLKDGDVRWLHSLVPDKHIKIFHQGGHMGQLATKSGRAAMIDSIDEL